MSPYTTLEQRENSLAPSSIETSKTLEEKPFTLTTLPPFSGNFGYEEAAHLLRRTTMGVTYAQIQEAVNNGLEATVNSLLTASNIEHLPLNFNDENDPNTPIGDTWVDKPYPVGDSNINSRKESLGAWGMKFLIENNLSIQGKMTLFWHNHFAIESIKVDDPKYRYKYIALLRQNCLGNFRQLVKDISVDNAMLYYLDGHQSSGEHPNENYSREVLELFTIGKGPIAGPGDYTNYTEDDVLALAKVFTGWRARGRLSDTIHTPYSEFDAEKHDNSEKQLSHRFGNAIIPGMGDQEYAYAIDVIFQQDEVAYFICRKLYRYFVNYDLEPIESTVIHDMAQCLIDNDYEITAVLEVLFKSEHFFDLSMRGTIIKNPLEFVCSIMRQFEVEYLDGVLDWYPSFFTLDQRMAEMGMQIYKPPNVAGWTAYYLEPQFSEQWINSVTLAPRQEFSLKIARDGNPHNGYSFRIDPLSFVAQVPNAADPNELINGIARIIFAFPLNQAQLDYLKEILIPGLPDFEWGVEYNDYLANPDNQILVDGISSRLRNLLERMLSMPEFHII